MNTILIEQEIKMLKEEFMQATNKVEADDILSSIQAMENSLNQI